MTNTAIAVAMQRMETVLQRRPDFGLQDDAPATARWQGGTRIAASHPNGMQLLTDLPTELGGTGDQVSPGWPFRAGIASCLATTIVLHAAAQGIELATLEVLATSRSDTRGLLGMADAQGDPVNAACCEMKLSVRICAHGVAPERLRALVELGYRCASVPMALVNGGPLALHIDVNAD